MYFIEIHIFERQINKYLASSLGTPRTTSMPFVFDRKFLSCLLFVVMTFRILWRLPTILKTSNKSVWSNAFWYVKVCIFYVYVYSESLYITLYIEIKQMLKNFFLGQNKRYKKCTLFSFTSSNSSQF